MRGGRFWLLMLTIVLWNFIVLRPMYSCPSAWSSGLTPRSFTP
jgi:hypothetical protein